MVNSKRRVAKRGGMCSKGRVIDRQWGCHSSGGEGRGKEWLPDLVEHGSSKLSGEREATIWKLRMRMGGSQERPQFCGLNSGPLVLIEGGTREPPPAIRVVTQKTEKYRSRGEKG